MTDYSFDQISGVTPIEDVFYEKPNYSSIRPTPIRGYSRPTYNDRYEKPYNQPAIYESYIPEQMPIHHVPVSLKEDVLPKDPVNIPCQDIAAHIKNCPICSSLYRRYDSIYIGIIVVLLVIIFILVRKLMI
jgi:hypothetical protein